MQQSTRPGAVGVFCGYERGLTLGIVHYVSLVIGIGGVSVICWGVVLSLVRFVGLEIQNVCGVDTCRQREMLRHSLGSYLLLALEFLVAADISKTIVTPSLYQVAVLASVVGIRTVLNYFLSREIAGGPCYPDKSDSRARQS